MSYTKPCKCATSDRTAASCSCDCCETCSAANAQAQVQTSNGAVLASLGAAGASRAFGQSLPANLSYANRMVEDLAVAEINSGVGNNWFAGFAPYLCLCREGEVCVVLSPTESLWYDDVDGELIPRYGVQDSLTHDDEEKTYILSLQDSGRQITFAAEGHPTAPAGAVISFTSAGGAVIHVTAYSADGLPIAFSQTETTTVCCEEQQITTQTWLLGEEADEMVNSAFLQSDWTPAALGAGKMVRSILQTRQVNDGPLMVVQRIVLEYWGSHDRHGSLNDLKSHATFAPRGSKLVETARNVMVYYKGDEGGIGFQSGLKYLLRPEAWRRLQRDPNFIDLDTTPDSLLAKYADQYVEYDGDHRATRSVIDGGEQDYQFTFDVPAGVHDEEYNHWQSKTITTRPDGSTLTAYYNHVQQVLLSKLANAEDDEQWLNAFHYHATLAQQVWHAHPSAVVSFDEGEPDLDISLREDAGLIDSKEYYTTTGGGAAEGHLHREFVQEGSLGTPIKQAEYTYIVQTEGDAEIVLPASTTKYRDDAGTEPITTSNAYTFHAGTLQVAQVTATLPVVPTSQNGDGVAHTTMQLINTFGLPTWSKDARGVINYRVADPVTGGTLQTIDDVDMSKMDDVEDKPAWITPPGGGLHRVSDFTLDYLGRSVLTLGPAHDVDGTLVRTASFMVYLDAEHETRSAGGFASLAGSPGHYEYTIANPVSISKLDHAGRTVDSVQAVRASVNGILTAADEFSRESWVSWSKSIYANDGDLLETRLYHSIPECGEGLRVENYDATLYGYDEMGRQNRTVTPAGTITRNVFDLHGRTVST